MLKAATIAPLSGHHTSTCIFMHGLGDSGYGWSDVAELLAKRLPNTKFILPHAPNRKVTMNGGVTMRAWYDFYGLSESDPQDQSGIIQSAASVLELASTESKTSGIPRSKIIIGGFSQGGAVALTSGLLYKQITTDQPVSNDNFAGIMAISTYLPIQDYFKANLKDIATQTPILMTHGTVDGVVSYRWAKHSVKVMKEDLVCESVNFMSVANLAHSVNAEVIDAMASFMKQVLKE